MALIALAWWIGPFIARVLLLVALTKQPGRVLTHQHLLREVCGPGAVEQHHYLRVYMAQLRHKIEMNPARPRHLVTEPGVGYRLRDD